MSRLHNIGPAPGATQSRKRVGRGPGSGLGKTAGRGENGQKSRSGYSRRWGFEGGQMPLVRRLPKRGFTSIFRQEYAAINLGALEGLAAGTVITPQLLVDRGLIKKTRAVCVKLLGHGEAGASWTVKLHMISAGAKQKVEAAGGRVELLEA